MWQKNPYFTIKAKIFLLIFLLYNDSQQKSIRENIAINKFWFKDSYLGFMGKNNYFTRPCENEIFKRKKLKLPFSTNYPFHEHHVSLQRWQIEKINLLKPMPKYCTQTWIALRILCFKLIQELWQSERISQTIWTPWLNNFNAHICTSKTKVGFTG